MKLLLLLASVSILTGCAATGHTTKLYDSFGQSTVYCWEPQNKFTDMVGFANVKIDRKAP